MTHVLIVEDDPDLRRSLVLSLTAQGYSVDEAETGEQAIRLAGRHIPDVVTVDLGLPGMSGMDVIKALRNWGEMPIIVLSARADEGDKVEALDAGATDYVTKPVGIEELLARLRAAERIVGWQGPAEGPITTEDFVVDRSTRTVHDAQGERIHLTRIEWGLLEHISRRPGHLVSQIDLLHAIWGPAYGSETHYLRVHISNLRKKLEPDPATPKYIITEPGVGYRFMVDDE